MATRTRTPKHQVKLTSHLLQAAADGDLETVQELIEQKQANPNWTDYDKRSALHLAATEGFLDVVQYLAGLQGIDFNITDRDGNTPLNCAIAARHNHVAEFLQACNASLGEKQGHASLSAQFLNAAAEGDEFTVRSLLRNRVPPDTVDYDRRSALHVASARGHYNVVVVLVEAGANVNATDNFDITPLDDAQRNSARFPACATIAAYLQQNGAKGSDDLRILKYAGEGNLEKLKELVTANPGNINIADYDGRTALHVAAGGKHAACVQYLLQAGADPTMRDNFGFFALDDAKRGGTRTGFDESVKLLEAAMDAKGFTSGNIETLEDKSATHKHVVLERRFCWTFLWVQICILALFGVFVRYNDQYAKIETTPPSDTAFSMMKQHMATYYPMYQDVHVMIYIGFGFLMTFLRKYGYTALGLNFLLAAVSTQWYILTSGFWYCCWNGWHSIPMDVTTLITADFCAGAVLITYGAVLGKLSAFQMMCVCLIEVPAYALNEQIAHRLGITDAGGSMVIHVFGSTFGLALAYTSLRDEAAKVSPDNAACYRSDLFSMIGTIFLFMFWPSFNAALAVDGGSSDNQNRAVINTVLSLVVSVVMAFVCSAAFRHHKRFDMVDIQNATLAGGVAVGNVADLMIQPYGAMCIGFLAGILSVVGYVYIQPFLQKHTGLSDTCGILNLHFMPGVLGAGAGAFASGMAAMGFSLNDYYDDAHKAQFWKNVNDRAGSQMVGFQLVFLLITWGIAGSTGALMGLALRIEAIFGRPPRHPYLDVDSFEVPSLELPYYFDERGEIARKPAGAKKQNQSSSETKPLISTDSAASPEEVQLADRT